jgi:hypothetical protein
MRMGNPVGDHSFNNPAPRTKLSYFPKSTLRGQKHIIFMNSRLQQKYIAIFSQRFEGKRHIY